MYIFINWKEKITDKIHTHKKPKDLIKNLILATSEENDLIGDFASGSFVVKDVCEETGRNFIGCDIKL